MNSRILSIIVLIVVLEVLIGNELNMVQICTRLAVASREDHTVTLISDRNLAHWFGSLQFRTKLHCKRVSCMARISICL